MFHSSYQTSSTPQDDFISPGYPEYWYKTSNVYAVSSFSAICLLYAKYLTQTLGNKVCCILTLLAVK